MRSRSSLRPRVPVLRQDALAAWTAGVDAVRPEACVRRALDARPDLDLSSRDLLVLAVGKAAAGMIRGAFASVPDDVPKAPAIALVPEGTPTDALPPHVRVLRGGHPHPTAGGMGATRSILAEVDKLREHQRLLVLLSGGTSALLENPVDGLGGEELVEVHRLLVASGLPIAELNLVRGCLSAVKHGGLARRAAPARVTTLAISDVEDDDPGVLGSGPTVATEWSRHEARARAAAVVRNAGLRLPEAARRVLDPGGSEPGERAVDSTSSRTAKEADYEVVASVADASDAACSVLAARGYRVERGTLDGRPYLRGETSTVARRMGRLLGPQRDGAPRALVFGGETTVTVPLPSKGRGGRCLDLAARLALAIAGREDVVVLAAGTDGCDGSSRAAGAMVDGETVERAAGGGSSPRLEEALAAFDSEAGLEGTGDLLVTGPTGTNVGDLVVALVAATTSVP